MIIKRLLAVLAGLLVTASLVLPGTAEATRRACSANKARILYGAVVDGHSQLFSVRPDGSGLRQLTHQTDGDVANPDWSPDGRRIAFEYQDEDEGLIGFMDADGSNYSLRPRTDGPAGQPYYSPDGRHLYFEHWNLDTIDAIFSSTLDGRHERQVTFPDANHFDTDPAISPDGRTLSFVRIQMDDETQSALFTQDLRTGKERQLTPFSEDVAVKQGWSPNGSQLTYTRAGYQPLPGISSNVMTIGKNGKHPRDLTKLTGGATNALTGSYSPDGQWIAYRLETPTGSALMKVHPWGGTPVKVFQLPGIRPRYIDWGPCPR